MCRVHITSWGNWLLILGSGLKAVATSVVPSIWSDKWLKCVQPLIVLSMLSEDLMAFYLLTCHFCSPTGVGPLDFKCVSSFYTHVLSVRSFPLWRDIKQSAWRQPMVFLTFNESVILAARATISARFDEIWWDVVKSFMRPNFCGVPQYRHWGLTPWIWMLAEHHQRKSAYSID